MCDLYLYYYEDGNVFIDECGEIVYDLFTVITPQDLFLFRNIPEKYEIFPMIDHPEITIHIIAVPMGELCGLYWLPEIHPEMFVNGLINIRKEYGG